MPFSNLSGLSFIAAKAQPRDVTPTLSEYLAALRQSEAEANKLATDEGRASRRRSIAKLLLSRMRERRMARVGIELRVELLKAQALARAQLVDHRAKLADFEDRVRETEDLWGQPFQRWPRHYPAQPGHD